MSRRPNFWPWPPWTSVSPLCAGWSCCSRVWIEHSVRNTAPCVALPVYNTWTLSGESRWQDLEKEKKKISVFLGSIFILICHFRSLWHGMLVVASFIQHVTYKVKQDDSRLKDLALKHCNLHLNVCKNGFCVFCVSLDFTDLLSR